MNDVVLIQFRTRYEKEFEDVAIATNLQVAKEYVNKLQEKYPDAYTHGRFYYTEFRLITEQEQEWGVKSLLFFILSLNTNQFSF